MGAAARAWDWRQQQQQKWCPLLPRPDTPDPHRPPALTHTEAPCCSRRRPPRNIFMLGRGAVSSAAKYGHLIAFLWQFGRAELMRQRGPTSYHESGCRAVQFLASAAAGAGSSASRLTSRRYT